METVLYIHLQGILAYLCNLMFKGLVLVTS